MSRREQSHLDEWAALLGVDVADDPENVAPETRWSRTESSTSESFDGTLSDHSST